MSYNYQHTSFSHRLAGFNYLNFLFLAVLCSFKPVSNNIYHFIQAFTQNVTED